MREGKREDGNQSNNELNNSVDHMGDHFDTNYVLQEIAKIPSIFGRRNNVARKFD